MEVTGHLPTKAEKQALYETLLNFENWKASVPEVIEYEKLSENLYEMTVKVELGPLKGDQKVKVEFTTLEPPDSANFEIQNPMIKSARGNFILQDLIELEGQLPGGDDIPAGTKTVIIHRLELDAGNPFFNTVLEGFKGQIKSGFEELLGQLSSKAETAN